MREAYEAAKITGDGDDKSSPLFTLLLGIATEMIRAGDVAGALRCAADIQINIIYNAFAPIAAAQRKAGDQAAARQTFRIALEAAEESRHRKLPPGILDSQWNAAITQQVAKIRAMMGDYQEAQEVAESLAVGDRLPALEEIARVRAASGDAAGALEWARGLDLPSGSERLLAAIARGIDEADLPDPPE